MAAPDPGALLAALPIGSVMWIEARGRSMWPVLWPGDALKVERCTAVSKGDVAILRRSDNALIAHLVVATDPLVTASMTGRIDGRLEPLGRALAVRRLQIEVPLSRRTMLAFHDAWVLARRSPLRAAWRAMVSVAASPPTAGARQALLAPRIEVLDARNMREVALALPSSLPSAELEALLANARVAGIRVRGGSLAGVAIAQNGKVKQLFVRRRVNGLGLEDALRAAVTDPPAR